MRIVIVGAGEVGVHIASSLVHENHDLVVIERDPRKVESLQTTMDILADLSARRREGQLIVGFAAEVEDHLERARKKLEGKGLDIIVMNDVSRPGIGFEGDMNEAVLLCRDGSRAEFPVTTKRELAGSICRAIEQQIKE